MYKVQVLVTFIGWTLGWGCGLLTVLSRIHNPSLLDYIIGGMLGGVLFAAIVGFHAFVIVGLIRLYKERN